LKLFKAKFERWAENKLNDYANRIAYINRAETLNNCAHNSAVSGISNEKYCGNEIAVSLTTYGKRLYMVHLAIESIMQQTLKPNRIVLWISDELNHGDIPLILKKQQERGLEIRFCRDIFSYTKLIPALCAFPLSAIITVDDDHLYNFDLVENLVNSHKKNPKLIHCARMHRMKLLGKNKLEKYVKWTWNYGFSDISPLNFPCGNGGVLYPPGCFNKEVFNQNVFLDICKYADDVWFKAMSLLNNTQSVKLNTYNDRNSIPEQVFQDTALTKMNIDNSMNDKHLKAVFDKYNLYEKLI
jgi:hypothetical protein